MARPTLRNHAIAGTHPSEWSKQNEGERCPDATSLAKHPEPRGSCCSALYSLQVRTRLMPLGDSKVTARQRLLTWRSSSQPPPDPAPSKSATPAPHHNPTHTSRLAVARPTWTAARGGIRQAQYQFAPCTTTIAEMSTRHRHSSSTSMRTPCCDLHFGVHAIDKVVTRFTHSTCDSADQPRTQKGPTQVSAQRGIEQDCRGGAYSSSTSTISILFDST